MSLIAILPISERIADALFERLQLLESGHSVLTPSPQVVRPTRLGGFTPKDRQVVLTQSSPERVPELDYPGNPPANCYSITFNIRCHVLPSEKDPTPIDTIVNAMSADVVKVITEPTNWHTFGGLAIDAELEAHENIDGDGGIDGVNVPVTVFYRTSETNPYTSRG